MAIPCWVPGCNHNNMRESCKFFTFPTNIKQRRRWLQLIRRVGEPGSGARVCSCHFREGKKENGPDVLPYNERTLFKKHHLTPEKKKQRKPRALRSEESKPSTSTQEEATIQSSNKPDESKPSTSTQGEVIQSGSALRALFAVENQPSTSGAQFIADCDPVPLRTVGPPTLSASVAMVEAENYLLKLEIERKDEIIRSLRVQMTYAHICESKELILEYTGLPTRSIFESLHNLLSEMEINYYLKWRVQKLTTVDQLLMTLMKLRQNFPHTDLAYRFNVSEATVTNVVVTYIHVLYEVLNQTLMKNIPSRRKNQSCLPNCASTFTNCRIILDATEIFCAVPRLSMKNQRLTYSSYKHRNTFKGLVGVAPNGVVTFLSSLYPGSTSDKAVVKHCGILSHFSPGDLILADKGFLIKDLLPNGVSLNVPPFLSTPQFTPEQVRRTECIAKARIHVERAIKRMKSYKILSFIPEQLFNYSSIIFKTVGALTNLQYPLIREVSQFFGEVSTSVN